MMLNKLQDKLKRHPNSMMILSYLFMMTASSFFGVVAKSYAFIFLLILPILLLILNLWIRTSLKEIWQNFKTIKWSKLVLAFLGILIVIGFFTFVSFDTTQTHSKNTFDIIKMMHQYWYMPIYVVLIAPIVEELTFRSSGYIIATRLAGAVTTNATVVKITAYFFVGIAFAVMHADNMMAIYMIFSWLLQKITNKWGLKYAIAIHIGINLFGFAVMLV